MREEIGPPLLLSNGTPLPRRVLRMSAVTSPGPGGQHVNRSNTAVEQIVVCGHLGCGGVRAALNRERHGLIDNWLRHVQDVAHEHSGLIASTAEADRADLLCRLNVVEQVTNLCRTTIVQEAWSRGRKIAVHGVVYGLADGVLRDLGVSTGGQDEIDDRREATVARLAAELAQS